LLVVFKAMVRGERVVTGHQTRLGAGSAVAAHVKMHEAGAVQGVNRIVAIHLVGIELRSGNRDEGTVPDRGSNSFRGKGRDQGIENDSTRARPGDA